MSANGQGQQHHLLVATFMDLSGVLMFRAVIEVVLTQNRPFLNMLLMPLMLLTLCVVWTE